MESTILRTFRLYSETDIKIRLLSINLRIPMAQILEQAIEDYWNRLENKPVVPNMRSNKAKRLLKKFNIASLTEISNGNLD